MTIEVRCSPTALDVHIGGADRLWGLRSRIEIPMGRVIDPRVVRLDEARADLWLRTGGLGIPGWALVGHFRGRRAEKQWWRVYRAPTVVLVDLAPESQFDRVVLQVDDPAGLVDDILAAMGRDTPTVEPAAGGQERADPAHAPGHRHRGPPPPVADPVESGAKPQRDQPWIRRSHSDSQQRRFRR